MHGKAQRIDDPITRVSCSVNSCYYWHSEHCHASSIQVDPPNASTTETTDCSTFSPK